MDFDDEMTNEEYEAWLDAMAEPPSCKCDAGAATCPRKAAQDGYCFYCVRMFPCDHEAMDRQGRISVVETIEVVWDA